MLVALFIFHLKTNSFFFVYQINFTEILFLPKNLDRRTNNERSKSAIRVRNFILFFSQFMQNIYFLLK
jgi:hypothetical protein